MEVASPAGWMVMHSSGRFFKKVEESFMERLNYEVLKKSGYDGYVLKDAPEKVLQFGEGNFLRAFVDYWFDLANEKAGWNGKCCLVQPIAPGLANMTVSYTHLDVYKRQPWYHEADDRKCDPGQQCDPGSHGRGDGPSLPGAVPGAGLRSGMYGDGQRQGGAL